MRWTEDRVVGLCAIAMPVWLWFLWFVATRWGFDVALMAFLTPIAVLFGGSLGCILWNERH